MSLLTNRCDETENAAPNR